MRTRAARARLLFICAAAALAAAAVPAFLPAQGSPPPAMGKVIAAFLSSEIPPYLKAFQGFENALGLTVKRRLIAESGKNPLEGGTRVVVVFGGRAAQMELPNGVERVVCLAPSLQSGDEQRVRARIEMVPEPEVIVEKIRAMQPELRVLSAFWASEKTEAYLDGMAEAGKKYGLEVRKYRAEDGKELYKTLKNLVPPGSAIWVSPDPLLINAENFSILREFSVSKAVPLYVPTRGLAESGGTVSISVSFEEMGRLAAEISGRILAGGKVPEVVYPDKVEVSLNREAAGKAGLNPQKKALDGVSVFN